MAIVVTERKGCSLKQSVRGLKCGKVDKINYFPLNSIKKTDRLVTPNMTAIFKAKDEIEIKTALATDKM